MDMATKSQKQLAEAFLNLHHGDELLVLINTWDPGSSRIVEELGFPAIATTSMGVAASLGYPDAQTIPFVEMRDAIKRIVDKVSVPVSADFEAGYGRNVEEVIQHAKAVLETGAVGINIEDSFNLSPELMDANAFSERISGIRQMADSEGVHLVINARTDVFLAESGRKEDRLKEAIRRGNIYVEAGADCVFIPNAMDREEIKALAEEINAPINILSNPTVGEGFPPSLDELKELGVARMSIGSSLMKSTLHTVRKIARDIQQSRKYGELAKNLSPIEEVAMAYRIAAGII